MITLHHRLFKRLVTRMKRTIREEIDADFRHNVAEKAIIAGFDFDHMHAMLSVLPCKVEWDGNACAEYLHGNGFLGREDAEQAVVWLEEDLGFLLRDDDRPGREGDGRSIAA